MRKWYLASAFFLKTYMTKKIIIPVLLIVLFILIIVFTMIRKNKVTDLESAYLISPTAQEIKKRIWKDIKFNKVGESDEFITSLHMLFGGNKNIYVADNNHKIIRIFNLKAIMIGSIGEGEGRGPKEFSIIIDVLADQMDRIWIMDGQNNRATIYDTKKNEISNIIDFPFVFSKVIPIDDSKYWVQKRFNNQIEKYSISGQHIGNLKPIVDDPALWSFVLENYSVQAPDGSIIQAQYHTNMFIKYSAEGELIYFRKPIHFLGLPSIDPYYANEVGNMNTVDFSSWKQITKSPQVVDTTIQLFIHQKIDENDNWKQGFIDVYNLSNGKYLYSYELPERLESIAVSEGFLAGISEELGKLIVWSLK